MNNTDTHRPGALQEPPDLLDPKILTPDQSCDLESRETGHGYPNFSLQLLLSTFGGFYRKQLTLFVISNIPVSTTRRLEKIIFGVNTGQ